MDDRLMNNSNMFGAGSSSAAARDIGAGTSSGTTPNPSHPGLRNSGMGSIYVAFEGYEREARQRKYLIAEYEDRIENLKKAVDEAVEANKALAGECEKLEMEAKACEATYEKSLKEKSLIENEFATLSKEMDLVAEEIAGKKTQLLKIDRRHKEQLELISATEEKFMNEYKKNPVIAQMMEYRKEVDELQQELHERANELHFRKQEFKENTSRYNEGWNKFVTKCVKIAEIHVELRKKVKIRDALRKEVESKIARSSSASRRLGPLTAVSPSRQPDRNLQRDYFAAAVAPRSRRTSTFQQMDYILNKSSQTNTRERRITAVADASNPRQYVPMPTPTRSASLISQLRSRLKGTVMVSPMPRNSSANVVTPQLQNKTATVAPSRSDTNSQESVNSSQSSLQLNATTDDCQSQPAPHLTETIPCLSEKRIPDKTPPQILNEKAQTLNDDQMDMGSSSDCQVINNQSMNVEPSTSADANNSNSQLGIGGSPTALTPGIFGMLNSPAGTNHPPPHLFGFNGSSPQSDISTGGPDAFFDSIFPRSSTPLSPDANLGTGPPVFFF